MDFFFRDPNEIRLPPEEVRLLEIQVTPHSNGKLVKVYLELTPFMKRPNLEVSITTPSGKEVAHTSILETMLNKLEFTMHLRQVEPGTGYTLESVVYYQKLPAPGDVPQEVTLPEPLIVDRQKKVFTLPEGKT